MNYFDKYKDVKFNDILLESFCEVQDISEPLLTGRDIDTLDIKSLDGELFNGSKKKSYEIEITVLIDCDTQQEYDKKLEELKDTFDVDTPKQFFRTKDKFTFAIPSDGIEPLDKELLYTREFKIKLFVPQPFYYSSEIKNFAGETNVVIDNLSKKPIRPMINIGFGKQSHFVQMELKSTGEKILIGKYPKLELNSVEKSNPILKEECTTTTDWVKSAASIDSDRATNGTIAVSDDGSCLILGTIGDGDTNWKGACYRKNLNESIDEFEVTVFMNHESKGVNGDPSKVNDDKETVTSGSKTSYYEVTCSSLNIRSGPGTKYKKIGSYTRGTQIKQGEAVNGWWKHTFYGGKIGYCSMQYLNKVIVDNTVTLTKCNMVALQNTPLRSGPHYNSSQLKVIPGGKVLRVILTEYTDTDSNGDTRYYYQLAVPYENTNGYVCKGNLEKASNVKFEYSESDSLNTADDKTGEIILYGFSANSEKVFEIGLRDDNKWYEYTYPIFQAGNQTILKDDVVVKEPKKGYKVTKNDSETSITISNYLSGSLGDFNNFFGRLYIKREKINGEYVWSAEVQKIVNGTVTKKITEVNKASNNFPTAELSYIVLYIGTLATSLNKVSDMGLKSIEINKLNATTNDEGEEQNEILFKQGDVLEIDCNKRTVYLNQQERTDLVDIGSRFFELQPGVEEINLFSDDDEINTNVFIREKY